MEKTVGQIIEIYNLLFSYKTDDFNIYRKIRKVIPGIEEEYNIYCDVERKLLLKFAKLDGNGNPIINLMNEPEFKSEETKNEYIAEIIKIRNEIIEINIEGTTLKRSEWASINIEYNYRVEKMLQGIINIEWEENQ